MNGMAGGGGGVRMWLGYAGLALLVMVLINLLVRRLGGWRRLFGWVRRETSRTVRAFTEPIAARRRYRRRLRFLTGVLRDPLSWADAEQAICSAAAISPGVMPYALALTRNRIGVLVAGGSAGLPLPHPWSRDPVDPRLWWIARSELEDCSTPAGHTPAETPLLVCLGTDSGGRAAVMLDLLAGPSALSVYGVPRTARAVVQALAAQLDMRLPAGAVEVAEGIHRRHDGMPLPEALRRLGAWFVVGSEPLQTPLPAWIRLLSLGVARGSSRLLEALPDQTLRLHGAATWLRIDPLPLAKAVARSIHLLPPHDLETRAPSGPAAGAGDLDDLELPVGVAGVSALSPAEGAAGRRAASWT